jgi:hypothetical protein
MSTGNVIGGHKVSSSLRPAVVVLRLNGDWGSETQATLTNPNTSQAAKEHSRQVIQESEDQGTATNPFSSRMDDDEEATTGTNPSSATGDANYLEVITDAPAPAVQYDSFGGKDPNRVLGGLKATLHSECYRRYFPPPPSSVIAG